MSTTTDMRAQLLDALRRRSAPLWELPVPETGRETDGEEGDAPPERYTWAGDDLLRMVLRMGRTLRRLGLRPGETLALLPDDTLPHLLLLLGGALHGHHVHLLSAPAAAATGATPPLPAEARLVICPPRHRQPYHAAATAAGVKLATLGGHWQGSFFMLQMVQQVDERDAQAIAAAAADGTTDGSITLADGTSLALDTVLREASTWAGSQALGDAPALVVSLPACSSAPLLSAMLAALLQRDVPLFRIPAAQRAAALAALPDAVPADAWLLGDAAFIEQAAASAGAATRFNGGRRIVVS